MRMIVIDSDNDNDNDNDEGHYPRSLDQLSGAVIFRDSTDCQ